MLGASAPPDDDVGGDPGIFTSLALSLLTPLKNIELSTLVWL